MKISKKREKKGNKKKKMNFCSIRPKDRDLELCHQQAEGPLQSQEESINKHKTLTSHPTIWTMRGWTS